MSKVVFISLATGLIIGILCGFIVGYLGLATASPVMIGAVIGLITAFTSVALIRFKRKH